MENPYVDQESYIASLDHLGPIEKARLLSGNWEAMESGGVFLREWFVLMDEPPAIAKISEARVWDMAATEPVRGAEKTSRKWNPNDPDYSVGTLGSRLADGRFLIEDVVRFRRSPSQTEAALLAVAELDGTGIPIRLEQEPGSAGKLWVDSVARHVLAGWAVESAASSRDKVTRALPMASAAERKQIIVLRRAWTREWLDELDAFPMDGVHDDQVDSASGLYAKLAAGQLRSALATTAMAGGRIPGVPSR
jgi:predicted phage terminase large subunit-like protein